MREGLTARPLAVAVGHGVSDNRQAHVLQRHRGTLCIWGADQYRRHWGRQEQAGGEGGLGKGRQERRWGRREGHGTSSKPACRHWVAMHRQHVLNSSNSVLQFWQRCGCNRYCLVTWCTPCLQISAAIAAVLEGKLKVPPNRFYLKVGACCLLLAHGVPGMGGSTVYRTGCDRVMAMFRARATATAVVNGRHAQRMHRLH